MGPSLGIKAERQGAVTQLDDKDPVALRSFADSADPALGLRAQYDDRDSTLSSTRRRQPAGLDLRALPAKLALVDGTGGSDAYQAEAEWRQFHAVGHGVVLAHRLSGGASAGQPSYAERYTLGGTGPSCAASRTTASAAAISTASRKSCACPSSVQAPGARPPAWTWAMSATAP